MLVIDVSLILLSFVIGYYFVMFILANVFSRIPRNPVDDFPDWGIVEDNWILTKNNKKIETWVVYPSENGQSKRSNKTVILVHGWGRNRGRMVERARNWGNLQYNVILFSSRDHGNSDKEITGGSIIKFAEDIERVISWWGDKVILTGHSIGAGACILVAGRNEKVIAVVGEASPFQFPMDLSNIYRPILKSLTPFFMPGLRFTLRVIYRSVKPIDYSPSQAAKFIECPVLVLYGELDEIFPSTYAKKFEEISNKFQSHVFVNANHSSIPLQPEYFEIISKFLLNNNLLVDN